MYQARLGAGFIQEREIDIAQGLKEAIIEPAKVWNICKVYTDGATSKIHNVWRALTLGPGA